MEENDDTSAKESTTNDFRGTESKGSLRWKLMFKNHSCLLAEARFFWFELFSFAFPLHLKMSDFRCTKSSRKTFGWSEHVIALLKTLHWPPLSLEDKWKPLAQHRSGLVWLSLSSSQIAPSFMKGMKSSHFITKALASALPSGSPLIPSSATPCIF